MKKTAMGSEVLDDYWHATRHGAHTYPGSHRFLGVHDYGLEVLGATVAQVLRRPVGAAPAPSHSVTQAAAAPSPAAAHAYQAPAAAPRSVFQPQVAMPAATPSRNAFAPAAGKPSAAAQKQVAAAQKQTAERLAATSRRLAATASRLGRRHAREAAKLKKAASRLAQQAKTVGKTTLRGVQTIPSEYLQQPGALTTPNQAAPVVPSVQQIAQAMQQWIRINDMYNAICNAADLVNTLQPQVDQEQAINPYLAQQGQQLVDQLTALVNSCVDDSGNVNLSMAPANVVSTVAGIQVQVTAWQEQVQQQGAAPATPATPDGGAPGAGSPDGGLPGDPMASGGGSDAGSGYDTSADAYPADGGDGSSADDGFDDASSLIQQYRQSGGAFDPFADGADQYVDDDAILPDDQGGDGSTEVPVDEDGNPIPEWGQGQSTLAAFRSSGGAADPFASDDVSGLPRVHLTNGAPFNALARFRATGGGYDPFAGTPVGSSIDDLDPTSTFNWMFSAGRAPPSGVNDWAVSQKTTMVSQGKPSPAAAARLAQAQKRLADAKAQLFAYHASLAQGGTAPGGGYGSTPSPSFADRLAASQAQLQELMGGRRGR